MTVKKAWSTRMLSLLACVLLLAGIVAGCKPAAPSAQNENKAMLESVAKWYVAQGALDIAGFKAGIYDPGDLLRVATMTAAPEDATKSEVQWSWVGDAVVVVVPSEQSTVTLSASPTQPNIVLLKDSFGDSGIFVMKKVDQVWKIDVAETQKAAEAASAPPTSTPTTPGP